MAIKVKNDVLLDVMNILRTARLAYFLGDNPPNPYALQYAMAIGALPETPNECVALISNIGDVPLKSFDRSTVEKDAFRIACRSLTHMSGYDTLNYMKEYLINLGHTTVVGQSYGICGLIHESPVYGLGRDENNRFLFSVNFTTLRI